MYHRIYDKEAAKKKEGVPRKWIHLEFLSELIFVLTGWQSDDAELGNDDDAPVSSSTQSASASASVVGSTTAAALVASTSK